ncbi:hypothetical protein VHUM_01831 [Vanrija humicola]|uniref:Enoyl reductase (ER) domain-containing protein n=1 Tax=Vanrija humicola TaxID=5417 RepID=A0A7D8Z4W6_VANHU|nr:hypothetical protein VHUM_01831 [Vanrija humicola]
MSAAPALPATMRAVVINGPFDVKVKEVPVPKLEKDTDVLIKVHLAGLCGSDLHAYRGHEEASGYVMGHEVVGTIVETGSAVTKFKVGDHVIAPFSVSCGKCFYCDQGYTSRCDQNACLIGGQAEYFRMPLADGCLFPFPSGLPEDVALLMTDILPTGYSSAMNARRLLDNDAAGWTYADALAGTVPKKGVAVVIGCGPVGLCAISSARTLFETVYATDLAPQRLALAEKHGAIALPLPELKEALAKATDGRGADAVLEVVGHAGAVLTALDLVRPYGAVSSVGVHSRHIDLDGDQLYSKNARLQFGRCSVRTFFPHAANVLRDNLELFKSFVENKVDLDEAEKYYELFEQNKVAKTVFVMPK